MEKKHLFYDAAAVSDDPVARVVIYEMEQSNLRTADALQKHILHKYRDTKLTRYDVRRILANYQASFNVQRMLETEYQATMLNSIQGLYKWVQGKYPGMATRKRVQEFLQQQDTYQLRQPVRRIKQPGKQYDYPGVMSIDLVDFNAYGWRKRYVLTVVDNYTKLCFFRAIPNKEADTVRAALDDVIREADEEYGVTLKMLVSDNGTEFTFAKGWLTGHHLKTLKQPSHTPNAVVERANRDLRDIVNDYRIHYNKNDVSGMMKQIQQTKNDQYHTVLKTSPEEFATQGLERDVGPEGRKPGDKDAGRGYAVGDTVRVAVVHWPSQYKMRERIKAHDGKNIGVKWSAHVYRVTARRKFDKQGLEYYALETLAGEALMKEARGAKGAKAPRDWFKRAELQAVPDPGEDKPRLSVAAVNKLNHL